MAEAVHVEDVGVCRANLDSLARVKPSCICLCLFSLLSGDRWLCLFLS
jgi:hypothetical protein